MSIDSNRRLLHDAASAQWGAPAANALMELLPPVDWDDFARRSDVENLRVELKGDIAELRGELKTDIAQLRGELGDMKGQLGELNGRVEGLSAKIDLQASRAIAQNLAVNVPTMFAVAGLVLAAAKLA